MKRFVLLLTIFALAVTGCGAPPTLPSPPVNPQPTAAPVTPATRTTLTPAQTSKDGIKIAVVAPLSGEQSTLGEGFKFAAQLAVKQLGKPLTDLGFKVEIVPFDDQARADQATARAKDIVADPDILVVIGNLNSDAALAASDIYKNADLAMIAPSATNPKLTTRGYANVNRLFGRDDMQGPAAAHFVGEQLQLKSPYIVSDKSDFAQANANTFSAEAKKMGLAISGLESTDEKSNLDSTVGAIKSSGADSVFFTGSYVQGGNLLRQLRDKSVRAAFIATERIDNPEFPRIAGQAVEGTYFESAYAPANVFPDASQFIRDYKTEFNKDAPPYAAQAYDATAIALKAIATLAKDGKPSRKAIAQAIRATQNYRGITGTYTFNSNGDLTSAKYFFVKVTTADPRRWEDNSIFKFIELAPPP